MLHQSQLSLTYRVNEENFKVLGFGSEVLCPETKENFIQFQNSFPRPKKRRATGTQPLRPREPNAVSQLELISSPVQNRTEKFENACFAFSNSPSLKSVFVKLRFCYGLVWTVGLTIK